jgi:hypothetical protein
VREAEGYGTGAEEEPGEPEYDQPVPEWAAQPIPTGWTWHDGHR